MLSVGILAFVTLACAMVLGCQPPAPPQLLDYWIVEKQDRTEVLMTKMEYRVVISTDRTIPTEAALRDTAKAIWRENQGGQDRFTIFMYLPDMDTHRLAYAVAEFNRKEMSSFLLNDYALRGTRWATPQAADTTPESEPKGGKVPVRYEPM